MRIGSNYAIRGGQAASRIAELEARVQELSSQVERSAQTVYLRTKPSLSSDTFFLLELDVIRMLGLVAGQAAGGHDGTSGSVAGGASDCHSNFGRARESTPGRGC